MLSRALLTGVPLGGAVLAWGAYHPASTLFGRTIRRVASDDEIALTFDDGPNPSTTPRLLDLLDSHGIRATFFVIGRWCRACPAIVRDIAVRGHAIGNHTDTHPNLLFLSRRRIVRELLECQTTIRETGGADPRLMRPPFGARGPQLQAAVRDSGLSAVVTWTLLGRDWSKRGKLRLQGRLRRVRGGDIVVLHDGFHGALGADRSDTVRALEHWLPRWKDAGLRCVTLE
jgi:peptidoglycan/xylan/chitin deacetylase (PgdA/CDA1 family)